mgnify:CR=1 FL=1
MYASDYKVNPETGRKFKAHRVNFANSKMNAKPDDTPNPDEDKNEYKKKEIIPPPLNSSKVSENLAALDR